jgi:hypothetical protein
VTQACSCWSLARRAPETCSVSPLLQRMTLGDTCKSLNSAADLSASRLVNWKTAPTEAGAVWIQAVR